MARRARKRVNPCMPALEGWYMPFPSVGRLPDYANSLVARAMGESGYPLEVEERDAVEFDSEIQIARLGRPIHRLVASRPHRDHLAHYLVSASYKILRFFEQPNHERNIPASNQEQGLPAPERRALRALLSRASPIEFDQLSAFLYRGMVRQLTSFPVDLRVEQEIAEEVTERGDAQQAYFARQVRDFEPTFIPEMTETFPERISRASQAMNVAFAEEAAELTGTATGPLCREARYRAVAEQLRHARHSIPTPGHPGDREMSGCGSENETPSVRQAWVSTGGARTV